MTLLDAYGRPIEHVERGDAWQNPQTGLGVLGLDKSKGASYAPVLRVLDQELTALYSGADLAAKIVAKPAEEMWRCGFEIDASGTKGDSKGKTKGASKATASASEIEDLREYATEYLELEENMLEGERWGRLYGGSLLVMGIDDGRQPWEPLDEENIRSFDSLSLVDRRYSYVQSQYSAMMGSSPISGYKPKYGRPEIYLISNAVAGYGWNAYGAPIRAKTAEDLRKSGATVSLVHETRVIRFDGNPADVVTRQQLAGWSWSVLQRVYDAMRQFENAFDSVGYLLSDASQGIFKLQGLVKAISSGQRAALEARLQILEATRSVIRGVAIDAGSADGKNAEDFTRVATPFGGIPDLLDRMMLRLSAAADMPATELFGRAPAGLNATGDNDTRKWYATLSTQQKNKIGPKLKRLFRLLALSKTGPLRGRDVKWNVRFRPLWEPTDGELADTRLKNQQRDCGYIEAGVIKPEEVAVELADVYPTGLDIEAREEVLEAGLQFDPYENEPAPQTAAGIAGQGMGEPLSPKAPVPLIGTTGTGKVAGALPAVTAATTGPAKQPPTKAAPVKTPPAKPAAKKTDRQDADALERQDAAALLALDALLAYRQDADAARAVFEQLLEDYHAKDLGWVLGLDWSEPQSIPLDQINFSDRDRWRASSDGTLQKYIDHIREGRLKPAIYVQPPDSLFDVVDGHHRTLANEHLGRSPLAYVAKVPSAEGPWAHLHSLQKKGSSKTGQTMSSREASRLSSKLADDEVPPGLSSRIVDDETTTDAARANAPDPAEAYAVRRRLAAEASKQANAGEASHTAAISAHYSARAFARKANDGAAVEHHTQAIAEHVEKNGETPDDDEPVGTSDAWDPDQPRDEGGRFATSAAVSSSREATARSGVAHLFGGAEDHRHAEAGHREAAAASQKQSARHAELGNTKAAQKYADLAAHHAELAESHANEAQKLEPKPKGPGPAKAKEAAEPRKQKDPRRQAAGRKAAETRGQNEEFTKQNIPAHLHPLFEETKGQFKGSPHERYEQFMHYAEEHGHEAIGAQQRAADDRLEGLIREYQNRPPPRPAPRRRAVGDAADVGVDLVKPTVVLGIVVDPDGRVLCVRQAGGGPRGAWWELPGGGVQEGETPEEALVREFLEETGIRVKRATPALVIPTPLAGRIAQVWRVHEWEGTATAADEDEIAEVDWKPIAELQRDAGRTRPGIQRLRSIHAFDVEG